MERNYIIVEDSNDLELLVNKVKYGSTKADLKLKRKERKKKTKILTKGKSLILKIDG